MKDPSLDDLMASMGVRKLDQSKSRKTVTRSDREKSGRPESQRNPGRMAKSSPGPEDTTPKGPSKSERRLKEQLDSVRRELEACEAEKSTLLSDLHEARDERGRNLKKIQDQQANMSRLEGELSLARGDEGSIGSGLISLLADRGILGEDERRYVFSALGKRRDLDGLLKYLVVADREWVSGWLNRRVILTCSDPACLDATEMATIEVAPTRCELCGGDGLQRGARDFVSGLLMHGWRRCIVLGGPPWAPGVLASIAAHPRVALTLIPSHKLMNWFPNETGEGPERLLLWGDVSDSLGAGRNCTFLEDAIQLEGACLGQFLLAAGSHLMRMN